jgi:hypothetical protein
MKCLWDLTTENKKITTKRLLEASVEEWTSREQEESHNAKSLVSAVVSNFSH